MSPQLSHKRAKAQPAIPDRLYFKIGDVARICDVETHVLRFWETQFPQLKPNKSGTGQRLYRRRDVETALEIKQLVHGEGYTLNGARQALVQSRRTDPQTGQPLSPADQRKLMDSASSTLTAAKAELRSIIGLLTTAEPQPQIQRRRSRTHGLHTAMDSLFPTA